MVSFVADQDHTGAFVHPLTGADRVAKARTTAVFTSQLTARSGSEPDPVLGPSVLARFARPFEVLFRP